MSNRIAGLLEEMPVVAAIKDDQGLSDCLTSECNVVFVLYGDLCNISDIVRRVKAGGKLCIVHLDLIEGLEGKNVSVRYLREHTEADGIISTKPQLVKYAKELGMVAVQRFFVVDSIGLANVRRHLETGGADLVEILPAASVKAVVRMLGNSPVPLIAGGLILTKEDVITALQSGALAVSSTNRDIWFTL